MELVYNYVTCHAVPLEVLNAAEEQGYEPLLKDICRAVYTHIINRMAAEWEAQRQNGAYLILTEASYEHGVYAGRCIQGGPGFWTSTSEPLPDDEYNEEFKGRRARQITYKQTRVIKHCLDAVTAERKDKDQWD
jgi:hypothetical protein